MRLVFQDGWPFRAPKIFVDGITSQHVNSEGEVCLWTAADSSFEWLKLAAINERIELWTQRALQGFKEEDLVLDAHLYFEKHDRTLAVIDVPSLKQGAFEEDDRGDLHGIVEENKCVRILAGIGDRKLLRGRWYFRSSVSIPPRNLLSFRETLTTNQGRNFDRKIEATKKGGEHAIQLAALIWRTSKGLNAQIIRLEASGREIKAAALQVAPTDDKTLKLRSGPDSEVLSRKRVVLFGLGAIGSHVAVLLTEMGVQTIVLVDGDTLRPGNIVRHAARRQLIGLDKANAVARTITERTPWTIIEPIPACPWHPDEIKNEVQGADVVLEATGLSSFAGHLSSITEELGLPFVSVALYRGGKIARVRRQLPGRDFPIYGRRAVEKYPVVPPGDDEVLGLEAGCSAPIINASPARVVAAATIAVRIAVDILAERAGPEEDFIQIYEPLDARPFDKLGFIAI
jgi:ThiF family